MAVASGLVLHTFVLLWERIKFLEKSMLEMPGELFVFSRCVNHVRCKQNAHMMMEKYSLRNHRTNIYVEYFNLCSLRESRA